MAATEYPLRLKINAIVKFKICPTKNVILTNQQQKTRELEASHIKDKPIVRSFSYKTRGNLVILHLALISVFSPRIAFILGRRE
jgi:hypothetical protein